MKCIVLLVFIFVSYFYENYKTEGKIMPYKVGKKTKTKGWPILKHEKGKWTVIAHSETKEKAQASIRARYAGEHGGFKK